MEKLKSSNTIAFATTALFVASLFWLLNVKRVNSSLESGLENERLESEQLLSEKLQLEKEIQKFKDQISNLKNQNVELDKAAKNLNIKLLNQEADYDRMKRQNLTLAQVKKRKEELLAQHNQLQNELQTLRALYATLESKNAELNSIASRLEERNQRLTDDLNRAIFASVDQSQIEAVRGKADKPTIRAKRTKKLIANFQVPSNLSNLSFKIIDPMGKTLSQQDGTLASTILPSDDSFTASTDAKVRANKMQRVQMKFLPKERLRTGIYTIEVLNDNLYISSLKVKLK